MKLIDYIHYLQYLHIKHGDVNIIVMTCITHYLINGDFNCDMEYSKAVKPYYDKKNNCIVIHKEFKDLNF